MSLRDSEVSFTLSNNKLTAHLLDVLNRIFGVLLPSQAQVGNDLLLFLREKKEFKIQFDSRTFCSSDTARKTYLIIYQNLANCETFRSIKSDFYLQFSLDTRIFPNIFCINDS